MFVIKKILTQAVYTFVIAGFFFLRRAKMGTYFLVKSNNVSELKVITRFTPNVRHISVYVLTYYLYDKCSMVAFKGDTRVTLVH